MPVLVIVLIVVLLGVLVWWSWLQAKKRREALAALAARLGWRFEPGKDSLHDEEYAHFEIFRRGHSRAAYNTLWGDLELGGGRWPAKAGDFVYRVTSSSGKSTTTHTYRFSYLIVHLPWAGLPDLLVRREHAFDKLAGAFGFDDIDFESEAFSRRFHVKSPDKRFAYDVLHPRMMELLLSADPAAVDIEHGRCCLSDGRSPWKPEGFLSRIDFLRDFFEAWPKHLTAELETR